RQVYDYFRSTLGNKYEYLSKIEEPTFSAEVEEFLNHYAENKNAPSIRITDDRATVASNLFQLLQFCRFKLQQNGPLQSYKKGYKMDESTWAKLTVDSLIEVISNDIHEKISGDNVDQATKNCKTATIDQKITKKTTSKLKYKSYGKRPDSRVCWSDEETSVTLAYCVVAGPPFNMIDEFKWESDRHKLIKMGKNCTRNMIKDFKQAHNKYLSKDIIIQIRSQPRILFLVYEISNNRKLQVTYGGIKQEDFLPIIKSPSKDECKLDYIFDFYVLNNITTWKELSETKVLDKKSKSATETLI
ncbi:13347_t:CDS:2, partial [Cetraspora pellucida]